MGSEALIEEVIARRDLMPEQEVRTAAIILLRQIRDELRALNAAQQSAKPTPKPKAAPAPKAEAEPAPKPAPKKAPTKRRRATRKKAAANG